MKPLVFLLIFLLSFSFGICQNQNISFPTIKNQSYTLKSTLNYLRNNYNLNFSYLEEQLPLDQIIELNNKYLSLDEALDAICSQTSLEYIFIKNLIVIRLSKKKNSRLENTNAKNRGAKHYLNHQKNFISIFTKPIQLLDFSLSPPDTLIMFELPQPITNISQSSRITLPKVNLKKALKILFPYDSIKPKRTFEIGLTYPLTTNGAQSPGFVNKVAIIGMINLSGGNSMLEASGVGNINFGETKGLQMGGLFNYSSDSIQGAYLAGLSNLNSSKLRGIQAAGLLNTVKIGQRSVQLSGLINYSRSDFSGFQAAGLSNINQKENRGFSIAGLFNFSSIKTGTQVSGLFNAAKSMKGTQLTSLINLAGNLKGYQIAVFNFAKTIDDNSTAIGIFNYVHKGGYKSIELGINETSIPYINLKSGTEKFYNILRLGWQPHYESTQLIAGYGVGRSIVIGEKFALDMDLIAQTFFKEFFKSFIEDSYLITFQPSISKKDKHKSSLTIGPTLNMFYVENIESEQPKLSIVETKIANSYIKLWAGFSLGFRI